MSSYPSSEWDIWSRVYGRWHSGKLVEHETGNEDCPACMYTSDCEKEGCNGLVHAVSVLLWPDSEDWGTVHRCDRCGEEWEG